MASVAITIPDALVPRLRAAMRAGFPEYAALSDADAFKAVTSQYWKSVLSEYEMRVTRLAAEEQLIQDVEAARVKAIADSSGLL